MRTHTGPRPTGAAEESCRTWYESSSLRVAERRIIDVSEFERYLPFAPDLVPCATHPLVIERGLQKRMLALHLYHFLCFTTSLEHDHVNGVLLDLARRFTGFELSSADRLTAYRFSCDEAYHALFSADFAVQLGAHTGVANLPFPGTTQQAFSLGMSAITQDPPFTLKFLIALVSETLVTTALTRAPNDRRVMPVVRALLMDHAIDEARHKSYFVSLFPRYWESLKDEVRHEYLQLACQIMFDFLCPDPHLMRSDLEAVGLTETEAEEVVGESVQWSTVHAMLLASSHTTRELFRKHCGQLEFETWLEEHGSSLWEKRLRGYLAASWSRL